jgi:hypothetical protein
MQLLTILTALSTLTVLASSADASPSEACVPTENLNELAKLMPASALSPPNGLDLKYVLLGPLVRPTFINALKQPSDECGMLISLHFSFVHAQWKSTRQLAYLMKLGFRWLPHVLQQIDVRLPGKCIAFSNDIASIVSNY